MRQKRRDRETEKYVARKQVYAMGGGIELDDLMRAIDAKGGDYYKPELNPNPDAREAYNHFGMTGRADTLALQAELADEMRAYYGLNSPSTSAPQGPARYREMGELPRNTRHELSTDGTLISVGPSQGPAAAEAYKDDAVQDILNTKGDEVSDLMREYEAQNDRDFNQTALLALLGLGSGVGVGQVLRPEEEEVIALSQT